MAPKAPNYGLLYYFPRGHLGAGATGYSDLARLYREFDVHVQEPSNIGDDTTRIDVVEVRGKVRQLLARWSRKNDEVGAPGTVVYDVRAGDAPLSLSIPMSHKSSLRRSK
jgi:hypothetical protein